MATYLVGDIQGCYDPLRRLLDSAAFDPAKDRLTAVGDLVNRGPQSLEVVRFLRSLGAAFTSVLGNHDLHLLALAEGTRKPRKKDTLTELLAAPDLGEIVEWFRHLPLAMLAHGFLVVHAGVPPDWTLEQTLARAREVEHSLTGPGCRDFLEHAFGDDPPAFEESLRGVTRLRAIANALTRLRFCTPQGKLDFAAKGTAASGPKDMLPWFAHPKRALASTPIAFGHWAMLLGKVNVPNVYALDTACVWGYELTMLRVEDGVKLSCPNAR
jgi:bis(5'-nucleosyl)-tetraphosphatase (symmetrical)